MEKQQRLLEFLEGRRAFAYKDSIGLWTIGIGHLITQSELTSGKIHIGDEWVRYENGLSDEQIDLLFFQDMRPIVDALNDRIPNAREDVFVVVCSLAFNVGMGAVLGSTLLKELRLGHEREAAVQLMRWVYAGGQMSKGLHNRRIHEQRVWLTGVYPS